VRRNGLSKYDAPLRIQYQWGYEAFKRGGRLVKRGKQILFEENRPNIDPNTMQYREWQRGWNDAYYEQLEKGQYNGTKGRS
tara:strand:- start:31 stop:273 length:243 start_codon:yes stop_codon:yes gene_type:complete